MLSNHRSTFTFIQMEPQCINDATNHTKSMPLHFPLSRVDLTSLMIATTRPKTVKSSVKSGNADVLWRSIATPPHTAAPTITAISMPNVE